MWNLQKWKKKIVSTPPNPLKITIDWVVENSMQPSSPSNELESFKTYMSSVGDPIIELFEVPSKNTDNKLKCSYVPNVHRAIIKTIVEFFCNLSKKGQSVESLKEENIFYNKVERKLEFHVQKNVELLEESDRAQHFKLLHDVIKNLFGNHRIPLPIWDLLLTLRYYRYTQIIFWRVTC